MPFGYEIQKVKAIISDVTLTRALNTIYRNTTGRPLLVIVSFACDSPAINDTAYVNAQTQAITPPINIVGQCGFANGAARAGWFSLTIAVPNNWYYRMDDIIAATGTVTIRQWIEVEL